jgi:hypothetical protein
MVYVLLLLLLLLLPHPSSSAQLHPTLHAAMALHHLQLPLLPRIHELVSRKRIVTVIISRILFSHPLLRPPAPPPLPPLFTVRTRILRQHSAR